MCGCALRVRTRIRIINVAWAQGVMKYGRAACWTHLNSPSLLSRPPPAIDALPSVSPRVIPLLLPPGSQKNSPLLDESRRGAPRRQMLPKALPSFLPQTKVDGDLFTVSSRTCQGFNSASSYRPPGE